MTTVANLVTALNNRLRIAGASADVSSTVAEALLRQAFNEAVGELPPVVVMEATLSSTLTVDLSATPFSTVWYVELQPKAYGQPAQLLLSHQWGRLPTGIVLRDRHAAQPSQKVTLYYTPEFDYTADEIDTTCIFGSEWLEPYVLQVAARQAEQHMVNVPDSAGGQTHGVQWRVIQDDVKALHERLGNRWQEWRRDMQMRTQERAMSAPPGVTNPLGNFVNASRVVNRLMRGKM